MPAARGLFYAPSSAAAAAGRPSLPLPAAYIAAGDRDEKDAFIQYNGFPVRLTTGTTTHATIDHDRLFHRTLYC